MNYEALKKTGLPNLRDRRQDMVTRTFQEFLQMMNINFTLYCQVRDNSRMVYGEDTLLFYQDVRQIVTGTPLYLLMYID